MLIKNANPRQDETINGCLISFKKIIIRLFVHLSLFVDCVTDIFKAPTPYWNQFETWFVIGPCPLQQPMAFSYIEPSIVGAFIQTKLYYWIIIIFLSIKEGNKDVNEKLKHYKLEWDYNTSQVIDDILLIPNKLYIIIDLL